MLKGANISFIGFLVLLACAYSWAQSFECDLRTGEGCTNNSEHDVFTVISKGYRNGSRDVNKECKHFLKLKVKLTYNLDGLYADGTHLTSLSCRLEFDAYHVRSYYEGPMITVSEDPDITGKSPYFTAFDGDYRFSSRKNKNKFDQIISGYGRQYMNVLFENGRFQLKGRHETTLLGPAVFTPEHPDKELYIGINMQYAQVKSERMGLVTYSDWIGGGACKIKCDTWDMNAS